VKPYFAPARCSNATVAMIAAVALGIGVGLPLSGMPADAANAPPDSVTPIKHLIVVIGENRSLDHVFGAYQPKSGDRILNLLSQGIILASGAPGPRFAQASQYTVAPQPGYYIGAPNNAKTAYQTLPEPTLNGAPNQPGPTAPPFIGLSQAELAALEPSLEPSDLVLLTTGATGAPGTTGPDMRIANYADLPNGPFQLTGPNLPYDSYTGDTVHRFYQMWQQSDCSIGSLDREDPSGCLSDLYPFVATTYAGPTADEGGSNSMAFYNVAQGDAPFLNQLAEQYTLADNYHQPAQGGTGMQHVFMGTGDDIWWSDGNGNPTVPPASQIANPNPQANTNNQYIQDGLFSDCSDPTQPGVSPIVDYLSALPKPLPSHCDTGHYYLFNNTNPGYLPNGQIDTQGIAAGTSIPPSNVRTIGDALNDEGVSWAYYGGAYDAAVNLANGSTNPADAIGAAYCNICNFEAYATSIMGNPTERAAHIKDAIDFFAAVQDGTLPAVSFVKPDGLLDGHPATSKLDLFEAMLRKILDTLNANPQLAAQTAVFITFDEGGGYYDSGYIQPLDFFGDGPRAPLLVVSPYSRGGDVVHSYNDHVSILKFIERNWRLPPLTQRSRDNLPNPRTRWENPYAPVNGPAIGDLFDMFDFDHRVGTHHS
jgi:phospholipase C